jgi:hypothetical protein
VEEARDQAAFKDMSGLGPSLYLPDLKFPLPRLCPQRRAHARSKYFIPLAIRNVRSNLNIRISLQRQGRPSPRPDLFLDYEKNK